MLSLVSLFCLIWSGSIALPKLIRGEEVNAFNLAWFAASATGFAFGQGWIALSAGG